MKARGRRARRRRAAGPHGLLRHRRRRGWSRPSSRPPTTRPASSGRRRSRRSAVAILNLKQGDGATDAACEQALRGARRRDGVDVLYDDLDERPGAKFATADLIGIPWQIMVGPKGLAEGKVELKRRADGSARACMTPGRTRSRGSRNEALLHVVGDRDAP